MLGRAYLWGLLAFVVACGSTAAGPPGGGGGSAGTTGTTGTAGRTGTGGAAGAGGHPIEAGVDASDALDASNEVGPDASDDTGDVAIVDAPDDAMPPPPTPPTLSATGFFKSVAADGGIVLGDDVRPYEPRYKLWSDGADKLRWVYLPPGSTIDNGDQDHWAFPAGAKFWKEFAIAGKRIETRLVWHYGPGPNDYVYATYWWKPTDAGTAPSDAVLVPPETKINNANGTDHDVPFEEQCRRCHDPLKDHVLGFSAFQLTPPPTGPAPAGVTIKTLSDEGRLKVSTPAGYEIPGDAVTRAALGYLHANCGNCHNDTPGVPFVPPIMNLRVLVGQRAPQDTGAYTTALNVAVTKPDHTANPYAYRIVGGDVANSAMSFRMALRGMTDGVAEQDQMPPLATEHPDTTGIAQVNAWIKTLPPPRDR